MKCSRKVCIHCLSINPFVSPRKWTDVSITVAQNILKVTNNLAKIVNNVSAKDDGMAKETDLTDNSMGLKNL